MSVPGLAILVTCRSVLILSWFSDHNVLKRSRQRKPNPKPRVAGYRGGWKIRVLGVGGWLFIPQGSRAQLGALSWLWWVHLASARWVKCGWVLFINVDFCSAGFTQLGVSSDETYVKASTSIDNVGTRPATSCCGDVTYTTHIPWCACVHTYSLISCWCYFAAVECTAFLLPALNHEISPFAAACP